MTKYRMKANPIEAWMWPDQRTELPSDVVIYRECGSWKLRVRNDSMDISDGDYIVKEGKGKNFVVSPEIFYETYEIQKDTN